MQGWRQHMEDAHAVFPMTLDGEASKAEVFGVFDGHGGAAVAAWVAYSLQSYLTKELSQVKQNMAEGKVQPRVECLPPWASSYCEALKRVFVRLDEEMTTAGSRRTMQNLLAKITEKEQQNGQTDNDDENNDQGGGDNGSDINNNKEPQSLLHALLAGSAGRRPVVRIVEQGGHKYYQLFPCSLDDEEEEDDAKLESSDKIMSDDEENTTTEESKEKSKDDGDIGGNVDDSNNDAKNDTAGVDDSEGVMRLSSVTTRPTEKETPQTNEEKIVTISLSTEDAARIIGTTESSTSETTDNNNNNPPPSSSSSCSSESSEDEFDASRALYPEFSGTTAIVAVIHEGPPPMLIVANAGDSRAVLCRGGTAVPLSYDHKPDLPRERQRIENAGGVVHNGRIDGNLNLSRTLGDLNYKDNKSIPVEEQKISVVPDISVTPIQPEDEFVIIACDGIWDCLKNQNAVDLISAKIAQAEGKDKDGRLPPEQISRICEEVCDQCISQDPMSSEGGIGCDNMTLMVVQLNPTLKEAAKNAELPDMLKSKTTIFYGDAPEITTQSRSDSESD